MSQADLAKAAGTYQSVVGRVEAGTTSPSIDTLNRLVRAAGFELKLSLEPVQESDPVVDSYKADIDPAPLIENLRRSADERLRINASNHMEGERAKRAGERPSMDLTRLLGVLHTNHVEFMVTGGIAACVHGSLRVAQDVDIVYSRSDDNVARLVKALAPLNPYPRGAPPHLPFAWSAKTAKAGLNFSFTTTLGDVDLIGEVIGGGRYEDLVDHCVRERLFGHATLVISLSWLIRLRRAAGQARDLEHIAELELIQELAKSL